MNQRVDTLLHVQPGNQREPGKKQPSFNPGTKLYIVTETAIANPTVTKTTLSAGVPEMKVFGVFGNLQEANGRVCEIATTYREWHEDMVKASGGKAWHKGGKAFWDAVGENGHFFWVGARTRIELCRVEIHRVVVDWLQKDYIMGNFPPDSQVQEGATGKDKPKGKGYLTFDRNAEEVIKDVTEQLKNVKA
jgi:hypothetical protein